MSAGNPYDRTEQIGEDLPAEGHDSSEAAELLAASLESREGAYRENRVARDLTDSPGWRTLRQYLEAREREAVGSLIVGAQTNREMHFLRGELHMAKLLLVYVDAWLQGSENALEVFRAADRKEEEDGRSE